jgi:hypothetical protein
MRMLIPFKIVSKRKKVVKDPSDLYDIKSEKAKNSLISKHIESTFSTAIIEISVKRFNESGKEA